MEGRFVRELMAVLHMIATAVLMLLATELVGIARSLLARSAAGGGRQYDSIHVGEDGR
jgi:hypothetical protein